MSEKVARFFSEHNILGNFKLNDTLRSKLVNTKGGIKQTETEGCLSTSVQRVVFSLLRCKTASKIKIQCWNMLFLFLKDYAIKKGVVKL